MWLSLFYVCIFYLSFTKAQFDSADYEINQIDLTPLHDAIIFKDIADVINDFENNLDPQFNKNIFSEEDEDIEELLSEYHHYLDKAHKQGINYIEKSKGKNKIPSTHHDKYTKQPNLKKMYSVPNSIFNRMTYAQSSFPDPYNFISYSAKLDSDKKPQRINWPRDYKEKIPNYLAQMDEQKALLNLIPTISNLDKPMSSCYCKVNEIPCKCGCKQCFVLTDSLLSRNLDPYDHQNIYMESIPERNKYGHQNKINNHHENKLNIRLKIDIQLPKILSDFVYSMKTFRNHDKTADKDALSKEIISPINLPFPYLNFPIPIDLLRYKNNYNKHDNPNFHKITIRKKKKSRTTNDSKKQTSKKLRTFNSIKDNELVEHNNTDENRNNKNSSSDSFKEIGEPKLHSNEIPHSEITSVNASNTVTEIPSKSINSLTKTINLTVNLTKKNENDTNEPVKIENSIETDFVEKDNKSVVEPVRSKREAVETSVKHVAQINTNMSETITTVIPPKLNQSLKNYRTDMKKYIKTVAGELELLYWPLETKNVTLVKSKNITALILEREEKKVKLNTTQDKIRNNRTIVLEQAIFGNVDWNDVDTIAPVFMSFVGKYIKGIITFCSQSVCHSMKCADKVCLHRICTPNNRFNQKGHCMGNNNTDSVAAMESIMDLPSNIAFEVVDILKDKMLGKMYGMATICILSKCSTFVVSKKNFERSKCISKELSSLGHCPIVKN